MNDTDPREALVIRPGDTLIVRYTRNLTMVQATEARQLILAKLPQLADALVIVCDELAVYRPDPEPSL